MSTRQRLLLHAWLQTALWLAIVVGINHASSAAFLRVDVTGDQRFSLSETARRSVAALERPLLVQVWFTDDIEPPYHNHLDALRDTLEAMRAWSSGRMEIVLVDPTGDKEAIAEAAALGIQPVTYTRKDWDRQEARQVFMGLSVVYGERQTAVPALPSIERMEYEVVRAIRAVTTEPDDRPRIGWLQGDGEPDLWSFPADNPLGKLRDELARTGALTRVSPVDAPIPEDIDVLLVVGPQLPVPDVVRFHLDQFVMRGGGVGWFLAGSQPDFRALTVQPVRHDLDALLAHYGVQVHRDLVLDRTSNEAMVAPIVLPGAAAPTLARVSYPLAVVSRAVDRTVGPVRDVSSLVLPFVSTLGVAAPAPEGVEAEVWARTERTSRAVRGLTTLRADLLASPRAGEVEGPFDVVAALSGRFPSFYADRGLPPGPDGQATVSPDEVLDVSRPARMVVVGSADMVANNLGFVQNTVDWLLEDPALIDIRARSTHRAPLPVPDRDTALRARLAIAGVPFLVLALAGALVLARRNRS